MTRFPRRDYRPRRIERLALAVFTAAGVGVIVASICFGFYALGRALTELLLGG